MLKFALFHKSSAYLPCQFHSCLRWGSAASSHCGGLQIPNAKPSPLVNSCVSSQMCQRFATVVLPLFPVLPQAIHLFLLTHKRQHMAPMN